MVSVNRHVAFPGLKFPVLFRTRVKHESSRDSLRRASHGESSQQPQSIRHTEYFSHIFIQNHFHSDHIPALYFIFDNSLFIMNPEVVKVNTNNSEPALLIQKHLDDTGISGADFDLPHSHVFRLLHGAPYEFSSYPAILMRFIDGNIHDFRHKRPGRRQKQRADDFLIARTHNTDALIQIRTQHFVRRVRKMQ